MRIRYRLLLTCFALLLAGFSSCEKSGSSNGTVTPTDQLEFPTYSSQHLFVGGSYSIVPTIVGSRGSLSCSSGSLPVGFTVNTDCSILASPTTVQEKNDSTCVQVTNSASAASGPSSSCLNLQVDLPWTLLSGSGSLNLNANFGTKGVAAATNSPGSRRGSAAWTDSRENLLWLFGGSCYINGTQGACNDLWKYNGINWIWVSGSNQLNQSGTYGSKGTPASSNIPGARYDSVSWIDSNNNLWLHGGYYSGYLFADLWKFDGTNWTWISGSNSTSLVVGTNSNYGTMGVAASSNQPGARAGGVGWIDSLGNFWLYGGLRLSDIWKFDGTNWIWIAGSNQFDQPAIYGTKRLSASNNSPGTRTRSVSWLDGQNNLYLFGGVSNEWTAISTNFALFNDLWKFDGTNWVWIGGPNTSNDLGNYGTKGTASPSSNPPARGLASFWRDGNGNLWIYGGITAFSAISLMANQRSADLWKYDGTNWTWASGSKVTYGGDPPILTTIGAPSSQPGAMYGSQSWFWNKNAYLYSGVAQPSTSVGDLDLFFKIAIP